LYQSTQLLKQKFDKEKGFISRIKAKIKLSNCQTPALWA